MSSPSNSPKCHQLDPQDLKHAEFTINLTADDKTSKINCSMMSTYMSELDTIQEEESNIENNSEMSHNSLFFWTDDSPTGTFQKSDKPNLKFEDRVKNSDKMAKLWKKSVKRHH